MSRRTASIIQLGTLLCTVLLFCSATPVLDLAPTDQEKIVRALQSVIELQDEGLQHLEQSSYGKALQLFEKALQILQDLMNNLNGPEELRLILRRNEAILLALAGKAHGNLGNYGKEVEFFRRARDTSQEVGDKRLELRILTELNVAYLHVLPPRYQEALLSTQQTLELARELKDTEREADAFASIAFLADLLGDTDDVWRYYFQALDLYRQVGNLKQEASVLTEIGRLYGDASQYDEALSFHYQALNKYREVGDQKGQGEVSARIGTVHFRIGDAETAVRWYQNAIGASKAAHDTSGEIRTLADLLLVNAILGDKEAGLEYARQAQEVAMKALEQMLLATQQGTLQQKKQAIYDDLAFAHFVQSVGYIGAWSNSPDSAIPLLNVALRTHQMLPPTKELLKETIRDLCFLSIAHIRSGQYNEALEVLQQAEAIDQRSNSTETYLILRWMGAVREKQGKLREALALYARAAEVLEAVSLQERLEELKILLREGVSQVYQDTVRLLFKFYAQKPEQRYVEQALLYHQKGKARVLLDLLEEAKARVREGIDPALLKEEETITTRISHLHRALANPQLSKDQEKQLLATLAEQEQAWQALRVKMAVTNPKYAELTSPEIAGIQQVQAILGKETLLLEYILAEEKSFLWAVTQDGMQAYELPAEQAITQLVEQYLPTLRAPLYGRDEIGRHIELGRGLYQALLQPVANQLQGKSKLIIVPDGSLHYLPFETLITDDGGSTHEKDREQLQSLPYLVKHYTVTYTPSASVLASLEKNRRGRSSEQSSSAQSLLLAFGDPLYEAPPDPQTVALNLRDSYERGGVKFERLPYSAEEVQKIVGVYGITSPSDAVNLRERATEKRLREMDLTRYRILHFATHAILSDEVKWITQPALVLSLTGTDDTHDGFLQMREIFNLRLDADLVVLSACDTGRGKLHRGEGIVGLTRAFMYAGTPSVVASLWKVYDQSTSLFMELFYRNLKEGRSKAEALQQAKKQMIQTQARLEATGEEESLAAPYFWAPFILIGSGN